MPPKTKKRKVTSKVLEQARKRIRARPATVQPQKEPETMNDLLNTSQEAANTEDELADPSFDLDSSIKSDVSHQMEEFNEEWVAQLSRDDKFSLAMFLHHHLTVTMGKGDTETSELVGLMMYKSDRTIRQWRADFYENNIAVPDGKQGHYQRSGVLWRNEALNKKVTSYVRQNSAVKGKANLTTHSFCEWVNEDLLTNETLEPGFPRKISVETARHWLHELGFEVLTAKKGCFVDGHEREDVVEYRKKFLRKMVGLGFLNEQNAPTDEAKLALPGDLACPPQAVLDKTVVLFHDESTFQANDDQPSFWGTKGTTVMRPKSKGSGIMVSDFIDEKNGYLCLTQEEYARAHRIDQSIQMEARCLFEYGEAREGYWTSDKFIEQMKSAIKIAEVKYPKSEGWKHVWIFDHSSCHAAMADDSLDVNKMNVNPGGKQRIMHDGFYDGKVQKMNYAIGIPKGLRVILEERGVNTHGMNADRMREVLSGYSDFKNEKSRIERLLTEDHGHIMYYLPKFHCELNPIERVWGQSKRYSKAHCNYSITSLRKTVVPALESVPLQSIQKHFNKVRHYMFAYLEGMSGGSELEDLVKNYKKVIKSHRRISETQ